MSAVVLVVPWLCLLLRWWCRVGIGMVCAGWAVTILSPANRPLGSTCQAIGLNLGYFVSYTVFLALNSKQFCNTYLRSVPGRSLRM